MHKPGLIDLSLSFLCSVDQALESDKLRRESSPILCLKWLRNMSITQGGTILSLGSACLPHQLVCDKIFQRQSYQTSSPV